MKKLTKTQLKKIASIHAGVLISVTESMQAFIDCNLSRAELKYLDEQFEKIGDRLLNGEIAIYNANEIVEYVRKNYA